MRRFACVVLLLLTGSCQLRPRYTPFRHAIPPGPVKHVIVVSVDGLSPDAYLRPDELGLAVPALRVMKEDGVWSRGARTVYPAITFPAHTTMVTGREPAQHGVHANVAFDGHTSPSGTRLYAEDIRVPAIWEATFQARLRTALLNWPVTIGADADLLFPEVWPPVRPADPKLERALTTPGLLSRAERRYPGTRRALESIEGRDGALVDLAVTVILEDQPSLLLLHLLGVDDAAHAAGPWSIRAKAAVERADAGIARLVQACRDAGIWKNTVLAVVSDHGFAAVEMRSRPGVRLREAGLVRLGADGSIVSWDAALMGSGGQLYVYLRDPADAKLRQRVAAVLAELAADPDATGVARVRTASDIRGEGGDPDAAFSLEAAEGFAFAMGYLGPLVEPSGHRGHHGFDPDLPAMNASMLFYGPPISKAEIRDARLIDLAPTIARWLDVPFDSAGRAMEIPLDRRLTGLPPEEAEMSGASSALPPRSTSGWPRSSPASGSKGGSTSPAPSGT